MKNKKIALIGLGYVGLPLAVEFGKNREVVGLDTNQDRIKELKSGIDSNLEITEQELKDAVHLSYTTNFDDVKIVVFTLLLFQPQLTKTKNLTLPF